MQCRQHYFQLVQSNEVSNKRKRDNILLNDQSNLFKDKQFKEDEELFLFFLNKNQIKEKEIA
jgi:hypothetical protein